jgi:outer membrane lipoprotein SlyB
MMALMCLETAFGQEADLPVRPNTKLSLELLSPISTASSKKDDKFSCRVLTPAEYAGGIIEGHIRSLKRSGKANKESKLDLAFDKITLSNGRSEDFSGTVVEVFDVANAAEQGRADNEGTVRTKSTTVKTSVKRTAAGALIGALIGGVVAGGQGAAVGAAIGAGVGATTTLATKGADLEFRTGTQFTVESTGPTRKKKDTQPDRTNLISSPELPSQTYRAYTGDGFNLSVPENWQQSSNTSSLTFAPLGGQVNYQGQPNLTHGAMVGVVPSRIHDLHKAAEQLVGALQLTNSYLQRRGEYNNVGVGTLDGVAVTLSGVPPATGRAELVTVHTTLLKNGSVFYMITVVPEQEHGTYREAFSNILRSIQFQ